DLALGWVERLSLAAGAYGTVQEAIEITADFLDFAHLIVRTHVLEKLPAEVVERPYPIAGVVFLQIQQGRRTRRCRRQNRHRTKCVVHDVVNSSCGVRHWDAPAACRRRSGKSR